MTNSARKIKEFTLGFIIRDGRVLLGEKTYGLFKGYLNGLGGKIEDTDVDPKTCLAREIKEEAGIKIRNPELHGILDLQLQDRGEDSRIYIYRIAGYDGRPKSSSEMVLSWYNVNSIPMERFWESDKDWLPYVFEERHFRMIIAMSKDSSKIESFKYENNF